MDDLYTLINALGYLVIFVLFVVYVAVCTFRAVRDRKGIFFGELSSASIADVTRNMEPQDAISYVTASQREVLVLKSRNLCLPEIWRCKTLLREYNYIIASLHASDRGGTVVAEYIEEPPQNTEQEHLEKHSEPIPIVEQKRPSIRSIVLALKMAYENNEFNERIGGSHKEMLAKRYGFINPRSFSNCINEGIGALCALKHRAVFIQLCNDAILALEIYRSAADFPKTIKKLEALRSQEEDSL